MDLPGFITISYLTKKKILNARNLGEAFKLRPPVSNI